MNPKLKAMKKFQLQQNTITGFRISVDDKYLLVEFTGNSFILYIERKLLERYYFEQCTPDRKTVHRPTILFPYKYGN